MFEIEGYDKIFDKLYWLLGKITCVHGIRSVITGYIKTGTEIKVVQRIVCKKCGKVWYEEKARYSSIEYNLNKVEKALQDGNIMRMPK